MREGEVTADEVNLLVARYLQEVGMVHTSFMLRAEAEISEDVYDGIPWRPLPLVEMLQKGMLYMQLEKAVNERADRLSRSEIVSELLSQVMEGQTVVRPSNPVMDAAQASRERNEKPMIIPSSAARLLRGHTAEVFGVAVNADGIIASISADKLAILWRLGETPALDVRLDLVHQAGVTAVCWSQDGKFLATGTEEGEVCVFGVDGILVWMGKHHCAPIVALEFSVTGRLLSCCEGGIAAVWAPPERRVLRTVSHGDATGGAVWLTDSTFAVAAGAGVLTYEVGGRDTRLSLTTGGNVVASLAWNSAHGLLGAGAGDLVRLWKPLDERPNVAVLSGHVAEVTSVAWIPGSAAMLVSGATDFTVRIWDAIRRICAHTLTIADSVVSIAVASNGGMIAAGSVDGGVILIFPDGRAFAEWSAGAAVFQVAWDAENRSVVCCTAHGLVAVVQLVDMA